MWGKVEDLVRERAGGQITQGLVGYCQDPGFYPGCDWRF